MKKVLVSALLPFAVLTAGSAQAVEYTAFTSQRTVGTQAFTGALGRDFNVLGSGITVTSIGVFDSNLDGINGTVRVGIYDRTTGSLVSPTYTFSGLTGALSGSSRFIDLGAADFDLLAGQYSLVAEGFNALDMNGNGVVGADPQAATFNNGGGLISSAGLRYEDLSLGAAGLSFPTVSDASSAGYDAATFRFTATGGTGGAAVPLPGTLALCALGFGLTALRSRRKHG